MTLDFVKTEALGNDLVLVDGRRQCVAAPSALAVALCNRRRGVGGDGLLLVEEGPGGLPRMRMFNPDGTEDFCGNGLRCVAAWLAERGEAPGGRATVLSTRGRHEALIIPMAPRAKSSGRFTVEVELLAPRFAPAEVPARIRAERILDYPLRIGDETFRISSVSMGTAHTALFTQSDVPDDLFLRVSPLIERHPLFPERTSVLWCRVESPGRIRLRIWERGIGETLACGTGACAALAIGRALGHVGDSAEVVSAGGTLQCRWNGSGPVRLAGEARIVYFGRWPLA